MSRAVARQGTRNISIQAPRTDQRADGEQQLRTAHEPQGSYQEACLQQRALSETPLLSTRKLDRLGQSHLSSAPSSPALEGRSAWRGRLNPHIRCRHGNNLLRRSVETGVITR